MKSQQLMSNTPVSDINKRLYIHSFSSLS